MTQLIQYAGTHYFNLPHFDPGSALISSLSLCLLLSTNDLSVAALASFIANGAKFVLRWKGKDIFPAALGEFRLDSGDRWLGLYF